MGRQEWNRQVERDRNVLERILALLLALAALAHRAASLPTDRRLHLLAALGHGEAMARDFILAMASNVSPGAPVEATAAPQASDPCLCTPIREAGDAVLLAARFRMLALALGALLAQARSPCGSALLQSLPPTLLPGRKPRQASQFTPSPALRATSPPQQGER